MNHRHSLFAVLFAGILLMLGGCAAAPSSPAPAPATAAPKAEDVQAAQSPNALAGTEWQLESMLEGDAAVKVIPGTAPSLAFAIDRYAGYGGCDWFVGLHILKPENGLQMEAPQKTQGGCTTEAAQIEQQGTYMQLLRDSTRYAIEAGKLVMYIGEGQKALTMTPLEAVPFEGTTWEFVFYYSPTTAILTSGVPGTTITARFEGGKLTGNAGCNDYSATYERTGDGRSDVLKIGPLATTKKACTEPQGVMEQETAYLSKLQSAGLAQQFPRTMLLSASDGQPLLLYHAAPVVAGG
jgi:heat shock protein HslJ